MHFLKGDKGKVEQGIGICSENEKYLCASYREFYEKASHIETKYGDGNERHRFEKKMNELRVSFLSS